MNTLSLPAHTPPPKIGEQHAPLFAIIRDALRTRILKGEFQAGERLVEDRLSAEMAVSRIPVREALRGLAAEGLVTIEPRRGAYVSVLSEKEANDMVEVRATLEALNARLAAQKCDPAGAALLTEVFEEGMQAVADNDSPRMLAMNERFHDTLARLGDNAILAELMRLLRGRTALLFAPGMTQRTKQNWQEHKAILHAVTQGDADKASKLAGGHVRNTAQAYSGAVKAMKAARQT